MNKIKSVLGRQNVATESTAIPMPPVSVESFDESAVAELSVAETPEEQDVLDEIDTALDPIDADIMGIASLTDTTNKYQAVSDVIAAELQNGMGVSMEAAALINIFAFRDNLEQVRIRVSNESQQTVSAVESRVALEGIREVLAEWWQKLQSFLKEARSRFSHWIENAFNGAEQLKSQAEQLKEEVTNSQPGSGNIEFSEKGRLLLKNEFPNVAQEMTRLGRISDMVLNKTISDTYETAENIAKAIGSFQPGGEGAFNSLLQSIAEGVRHPADAIAGELTQRLDDTVTEILLKGDETIAATVEASEPFLGNAQFVAVVVTVNPTENPVEGLKALEKAMRFSKILIVDQSIDDKMWNSRNHQVEDKEVPRCSPTDAARIADGALAVANAMLKLKGSANQKAAIDRAVDQAGQNVANMNINENVESGGSIASALRSMVSTVASMPSGVTGKLVSFFGTTSRAALHYAKASLAGEKQEESETHGRPNKPNQPA